MKILIVGGGQIGQHLAQYVHEDGHTAIVVEKARTQAEKLTEELGPAIKVMEGDGADPKVLESAGIRGADVVYAVTGDDEDNLVVCTLAKFEFSVPRVITRVKNPKNRWMYAEDMGVDLALNQVELMAKLLEEEMTVEHLVTLLRLQEGRIALVEETIGPQSKAVGRSIPELPLHGECIVVAILRSGKPLLPTGQNPLQPGDRVLALTSVEQECTLATALD
ncbi:MAG: TrkA family potassium uptake protein [Chloroflexota bacterium]|nr:MAG: TrkA family potassium uptake protein [Chloroflexota bacterium]